MAEFKVGMRVWYEENGTVREGELIGVRGDKGGVLWDDGHIRTVPVRELSLVTKEEYVVDPGWGAKGK